MQLAYQTSEFCTSDHLADRHGLALQFEFATHCNCIAVLLTVLPYDCFIDPEEGM